MIQINLLPYKILIKYITNVNVFINLNYKLNIELESLKTEVKTLKQNDTNQSSTIQDINKVSH